MFDKLRYLLYLMKHHPNLEYLFWIDGDAVFTNHSISLDSRRQLFQKLYGKAERPGFVWGEDFMMGNAGVFMVENTSLM